MAQGSMPPTPRSPCFSAWSISSTVPGRDHQAGLREGDDLDVDDAVELLARLHHAFDAATGRGSVSMSTWLRIWRRAVRGEAGSPGASTGDADRCRARAASRAHCRSFEQRAPRGCCHARACPRASCRDGYAPRPGREWRWRRAPSSTGHAGSGSKVRPIAAILPSLDQDIAGRAAPSGRTLRIRRLDIDSTSVSD